MAELKSNQEKVMSEILSELHGICNVTQGLQEKFGEVPDLTKKDGEDVEKTSVQK